MDVQMTNSWVENHGEMTGSCMPKWLNSNTVRIAMLQVASSAAPIRWQHYQEVQPQRAWKRCLDTGNLSMTHPFSSFTVFASYPELTISNYT